ncbi:diguanylate cyclase domain-containing protein [Paenibacillus thermoaerophilus]|uniref:Diguanylate cyclase domain-containing protein n=1 Tax=Paenibacillus thermoaerophilus TaxID=1215385 RepID=A0ABW2V3J1_9BACL|nr:diguanylate cyclase [Paenibacillus thermoaerophilus]TMV18291.1 diguanylate cyclase [Paenibacillus thermoaerophilus]
MLTDLIANFALLAGFVFIAGRLFRRGLERKRSAGYRLWAGVYHGLCGIALLLSSFRISETTIVDFRYLAIMAAAYYGGLPASLLAGAIVAAARLLLFEDWSHAAFNGAIMAVAVGIGTGVFALGSRSARRYWFSSVAFTLVVILIGFVGVVDSLPSVYGYIGWVVAGSVFIAVQVGFLDRSSGLLARLIQTEKEYRKLSALHEAVMDAATEVAIYTVDLEGRIGTFNRGAEKLLGYRADEAAGHSATMFHVEEELNARSSELRAERHRAFSPFEALAAQSADGRTEAREWTLVRKSGRRIRALVMISPVRDDPFASRIAGYVLMAIDITMRKEAEERLRQANVLLTELSSMDGLTGIGNRRLFEEGLYREWNRAAGQGSPISLLLIGLDGFRSYNDRYGHLAGDDALRRVALCLKQHAWRPSDCAARFGGDRFAVVLTACGADEAARLAETIRERIEAAGIAHEGAAGKVLTASIGVATMRPKPGDEGRHRLIDLAERRLLQAKQSGGNRVSGSSGRASVAAYPDL